MDRRRFLLGLTAAATGCRRGDSTDAAAQDLSTLRMVGLDGREVSVAAWRGRLLVLNVWASWCAPCRAEMASLQSLGERLDPAQAAVAALSVDDDPHLVREYLRRSALSLPVFLQADPDSAHRELAVRALPETLIVRPDGRLGGRETGARDWDDAVLQARWRLPVARPGVAGDSLG